MTRASIGFVLFAAALTPGVLAGQAGAPPAAAPSGPAAAAGQAGGRGAGRGAARVVHIPEAPALNYAPVANPLPLPPDMTYGAVAGVAVNSHGHVFVYHRQPVPLVEFDDQGRFVRGLREGTATRAHSVRIDADDNIWLVDSGGHTVVKLSPDGSRVLLTLGTKGVSGSGDADAAKPLFNIPSDVAIAPNGDIFVAQGEAGGPDPRVTRFDRSGKFLATWSLAYKEGRRSNPHSIAIDRAGLVYVGDRDVMRIRVFQPDGTPVRDIQLENQACGLFIDRNQQLWLVTGTDGQLMRVDWDGHVQAFTGKLGPGLGEFSEAHMMAVAPNGDVYVADTVARKVEKFVKR